MKDLSNAQAAANFLDASKSATIQQNRDVGLITRGPNSGMMVNPPGGGAIANGTGATTNPDSMDQNFDPTPNSYTDSFKLNIADGLVPVDQQGNLEYRSDYYLLKGLQNKMRGMS